MGLEKPSFDAINDSGEVVGYFINTAGGLSPVIWQNGVATNLNPNNNYGYYHSEAYGISNEGVIVGQDSWDRAAIFQNGTATDLPSASSFFSSASGINDLGQIVGSTGPQTGLNQEEAVLWQGGSATILNSDGMGAMALAINDSGLIIGEAGNSDSQSDSQQEGVIWQNGQMTQFGPGSSVSAVNNKGQVVGSFNGSAFVWQDGTMTSLNSLLPADSGWWLGGGTDINDSGQIVGVGTYLGSVSDFEMSLSSPELIACYCAGTSISTMRGEMLVERVAVGDLVRTHAGDLVPVKWSGYRYVNCTRHSRPRDVWPVRISPDAFGPGMPHRDLWLSPDHAVFVEGVLIPIKHLINGATIVQEPCASVTYWHVELERHDVILAEGLPCESYLDTGNRSAFSNGGSVVQMHPDFALCVWEAEGCAPLVVSGPEFEAARQRLAACAAMMGNSAAAAPERRLCVS